MTAGARAPSEGHVREPDIPQAVGLSPSSLRQREAARGPWTTDDLGAPIAANIVCLGLIVGSWWSASGRGRADEQVVWLAISIAGVMIAGGVNGILLLRLFGNIRLAKRAVLLPDELAGGARPATSAQAVNRGELVHILGTTRFHRADCPLANGKSSEAATRRTHELAGLRACETCRP